MKCLIRLLLMTSSLLIASIAGQDDPSQTNLQKLKRAALRRNNGKSIQTVPAFGWGKRGGDMLGYGLRDQVQRKRAGHPEYAVNNQQPWSLNAGAKVPREKWDGTRKCEWYGCRVERSGWESQYGKRSGMNNVRQQRLDQDDVDVDDMATKRQGDRNGWNSAYGRRRRRSLVEEDEEQ